MKIFYYFAMILSIAISVVSFFAFGDLGYDILRLKINFGHFEDTSIHEIFRIIEGKKLFTSATVEYAPLLYGPVYFYVATPFALIFGKSFLAGRIVSCLSTALVCVFAYLLIKKFTRLSVRKNIYLAFVSLGLFFSANEIFDFWLYTAKVDALFLLFLVATFYFLLQSEIKYYCIFISAFFASLLFFTKQNGLILPLSIPLFLILLKQKKKALTFSAVFASFSIIFFLFFYFHSGDKFFTFFIGIPKSHPWLWKTYAPELAKFFLPTFGMFMLFLFTIFGTKIRNKRFRGLGLLVYQKLVKTKKNAHLVFFVFSFFLISFTGRMKAGAVGNSWIFFVYALSVFIMVLIGRYSEIYLRKEKNKWYFAHISAFYLLLFFQFYIFAYDYSIQKKHIAHLKGNEENSISLLCGFKSPMLFPFAGYLPEMLCGNRDVGFQQQSVLDLIRDKNEFNRFVTFYKSAIESGYYKTLIITTELPMEQTEEGIKFLNFQILNAKTDKQRDDFLSFRSLFEINSLILKKYKRIKRVEIEDQSRMTLRYFDAYYICSLE